MKCPDCKEGDIVEKKARRGNIFYGCSEYPKCEFTSNYKPIDEKCPECGHPFLVEKNLKSGAVIACPNRAAGDEEEAPKRRRKKKTEGDEKPAVKCTYSRPAPPPPEAGTSATPSVEA
jgi:DNA topoisomerase-1